MERKESLAKEFLLSRVKTRHYVRADDVIDAFMEGWDACVADMKNQKPETHADPNCEPPALTYKEWKGV